MHPHMTGFTSARGGSASTSVLAARLRRNPQCRCRGVGPVAVLMTVAGSRNRRCEMRVEVEAEGDRPTCSAHPRAVKGEERRGVARRLRIAGRRSRRHNGHSYATRST